MTINLPSRGTDIRTHRTRFGFIVWQYAATHHISVRPYMGGFRLDRIHSNCGTSDPVNFVGTEREAFETASSDIRFGRWWRSNGSTPAERELATRPARGAA
jgi:hypothetical protein